jgi:hypothetical protein
MALSLRPTGTSTAGIDRLDFTVYESGNPVGRIFESPEFGTQEDPYWFWSITVYVDPQTEIVTSGKVQTFNEAKARFRTSWQKIVSGGRGEPPSPDGD